MWGAMIPSMIQGIAGLGQMFAGLANQPNRPTWTIPKGATEALDVAKRMAGQTKLPGQDILETQLGENTAKSTRALERMGGAGVGALNSIYGQEANAKRNLAVDAARYYAGNQQMLQGALGRYANYQDKGWDKNVGDKYQEEAAASSALTQAGMHNAFSGINNAFGTAAYSSLNNTAPAASNGLNQNMGMGGNSNLEWLQKYLMMLGKGGGSNPYYQPSFQAGFGG